MRRVISAGEARLCGGSPSRKLYPLAGSFVLLAGSASIFRRSGTQTGRACTEFLALPRIDGQPRVALALKSSFLRADAERVERASVLQLRRRKQRVVVRAPEAPEDSIRTIGFGRRGHVKTLSGLGTREYQPTLFDGDEALSRFENDDTILPPSTRPRSHAICEMDEDATARLLREAELLSLCFEWDKD